MTYFPRPADAAVLWAWNETDLSQLLNAGTPEVEDNPASISLEAVPTVNHNGHPTLEGSIDAAGTGIATWAIDPASIAGGGLPLRYQMRMRIEQSTGSAAEAGPVFAVGDGGSGAGKQGIAMTFDRALAQYKAHRIDDGTVTTLGTYPIFIPYIDNTNNDAGLEVVIDVSIYVMSPTRASLQCLAWNGNGYNQAWSSIEVPGDFGTFPASWNAYTPVTAGIAVYADGATGTPTINLSNIQLLKHPMDRL